MSDGHKEDCAHRSECCCRERGPRITGYLIPLILCSLRSESSHGYQMIEDLKRRSHFRDLPAPPVVYRHLRNLEQEGMVTSTLKPGAGPARKVYSITSQGRSCLDGWLEGLEHLHEDLSEFLRSAQT